MIGDAELSPGWTHPRAETHLLARDMREKQSRTDSGNWPYWQHQDQLASQSSRRWRADRVYLPKTYWNQGTTKRRWTSRVGVRCGRQDNAVGIQTDNRPAHEDHTRGAIKFPQYARQVTTTICRIIFVNTPLLFDTVWNKLVPHIAKETLKKIIMVAD